MKTVIILEADTNLSRLLESVDKVAPILNKPPQRIGFMEGQFTVPDDFDTMFAEEIADMFEGKFDGTELFEKKS